MQNNKVIYGRLKQYVDRGDDIYETIHRREFSAIGVVPNECISKCLDFSYSMAFGEGAHRTYRSGGDKKRGNGEIFTDTFQGKIAEYGMYQFLNNNDIDSKEPDLSVEGLGKWDSFDLECCGRLVAVKSTKFYGQLLLLETKDWNLEGHYIPNLGKIGEFYDSIVLLRIKPSCEDIMKRNLLFYTRDNIQKEKLLKLFADITWEYDIAGFITNADLKRLIEKAYILPKGAKLNAKTTMDAENYYVQAGDMRKDTEFIKRMLAYKGMTNEIK